jgi:hypothetical protein
VDVHLLLSSVVMPYFTASSSLNQTNGEYVIIYNVIVRGVYGSMSLIIAHCTDKQLIYIHTYPSRFIPEGVVEVSQIFLRDAHALPKLVSYEEHCRRDRW